MPCPNVPQTPTASTKCQKGQIHWFEPDTISNTINTTKVRPYIIIGRTNHKSTRVILAPIGDMTKYMENGKLKYPYHAPLFKSEYPFLDKDCVIMLDQVYTVDKLDIWEEWYMGKMVNTVELDNAICYNFDLFETIQQSFADLIAQYQDLYKTGFSRK